MCDTCNGKGGIVVDQDWFAEFIPCPDSHCDYDKQAAINRSIATLKDKLWRCQLEEDKRHRDDRRTVL